MQGFGRQKEIAVHDGKSNNMKSCCGEYAWLIFAAAKQLP